jgi:hypothetical protein
MTERPQSSHFTAEKQKSCSLRAAFGTKLRPHAAKEPEIVPDERSDFRLLTGLHTVLT